MAIQGLNFDLLEQEFSAMDTNKQKLFDAITELKTITTQLPEAIDDTSGLAIVSNLEDSLQTLYELQSKMENVETQMKNQLSDAKARIQSTINSTNNIY